MQIPFEEISICSVCKTACRLSTHFGSLVCTACASFFRRTVALNIHYFCKHDHQCISKHCRACRFEACVKIAGMKRHLVKQKKPSKNMPLYILNRQNDTSTQEIVRTYMSPTHNPEEARLNFSPIVKKPIEDEKNVSKILKISNSILLKYYVDQVTFGKRMNKNTLNIKTEKDLLEIVSIQAKVAVETCRTCPGVDLLDNQDILILRKYFQFSNVWIESTWKFLMTNDSLLNDNFGCDVKLIEFIDQVKSTLLVSFSRLKLNTFEFAAFKAICIWKLVYHQTSRAMKIVGQDHYEGVTKALSNYYQTYTSLDPVEIAVRIGEISLLVTSIFQLYHDMAKLYLHIGLPF